MQRDMDYLRQMLLDLEGDDDWLHTFGMYDKPGEGDAKRDYHVTMLCDEGLLQKTQPGVYRMTSKGHDFLDHTRDQHIWNKSKAAVGQLKNHSITMLMSVAEGYVKAKLREITGLDLG